MTTRIRKTLVSVAFAAIAGAAITGATLRGESRETDLAATCETAAWPMIPAECLDGRGHHEVRLVTADNLKAADTSARIASNTAIADRFAVAFQ